MRAMGCGWFLAALLLQGASSEESSPPTAPKAGDLAGIWAGTVTHDGESQAVALELEPGDDGLVQIKLSAPVVHLAHTPLGRAPLQSEGAQVRLGPFAFTYDAQAQTLAGTLPQALVPVHSLPFTLRRVGRFDVPERPKPAGTQAQPRWTFEAGSPLWAGPTFANGVVYAGGEDGVLHAIDAATGHERWSFRAGGPLRTRATVAGGDAFFQADDGCAYRLAADRGQELWRVKIVEKPIERLPFDNPKSRYDRFGSDVTVAGGRLYLGTHDGRVLALESSGGLRVWEFATGDSVLAAPAVAGGRVYFGSYDGNVYALDEAKGQLVWKRDTQAPVVSTPAVGDGLVVVGNRSYDLLGLDAATGAPVWNRYMWFSWVESSATIRDAVAYIGSSDAAAVFAFDVQTGRRLWQSDVYGWAWGQPAVTEQRVYVGTSSRPAYLAAHQGGVFALDRATGRPVWRYAAQPLPAGPYGFPGSPAVGAGLVFLTGLDGGVYAFDQ